jgi:hypothetical protein
MIHQLIKAIYNVLHLKLATILSKKVSIPLSKKLLIVSTVVIVCLDTLSAQDEITSNFSYQFNRVQKYVSISPTQLNEANTLSDLNHYYKADWVKEYKSVTLTVISNGQKKTIKNTNHKLTTAQKKLIQSSDLDSEINVVITYLPKNNLSNSRIQEMNFSFRIDPEQNAQFLGGELDNYIRETLMNKVSIKDIPQYQVAAIKFIIDGNGHIVDAHVAQASKNVDADKLILKTICEMPNWVSAQYPDGTKTEQEFVFTIGDQSSCTMNMLDIKS